MTTRALITGIRGFTGVYLADALAHAGWDVFGTVSTSEPEEANSFACDLGDTGRLTEIIASVRPVAVIHLAAISFVAHGDISEIYQANLLGTVNLLQACAESKVPLRKVLLASSANIYGNVESDGLDESTQPAPANDYAVSKLAMELAARLWFGRLPIIIARPFNYTGVGQSENFLLPKIVAHFRRRAPVIELGNRDVFRDFSDVRRVVEVYRRLIESPVAGDVFNVCSGKAYSLESALAIMRAITGHAIEVQTNPAFVRSNEIKHLVGSRAKLDAAIGEIPVIPLEETLRWMYEAA